MDYSKIMKAVVLRSKTSEIPEWNKWVHRNLSEHHCEECLTLDGCWFEREKTPTWPHHPNCHCVLEDIPYHDVQNKGNAECLYTKFDPYLFDPKQIYKHGKERMLESWGYSILDVSYLQQEIREQGLQKYINGEYQLGLLNQYGQRINIRVEIPNKKRGGTVSFITGWMVYPNGQIKLNTPYGGK